MVAATSRRVKSTCLKTLPAAGGRPFRRTCLEFARVVFRPAFHDDFLVGVKLDGVAALPMHVAEKAVFPAAEREIRHRRGDPDVDADISCGCFVAESAGC